MSSISDFFNEPCKLPCPNCGCDVFVSDLANNMKSRITGAFEYGEEFTYTFAKDVTTKCSDCSAELKVEGFIVDVPDEYYTSSYLKLINSSASPSPILPQSPPIITRSSSIPIDV